MSDPLEGVSKQYLSKESMFIHQVSDEALEIAAGDYLEVKCSSCGGSCNSGCTTSTRRDTRVQ